jgi:hypothetical protein
MSEAAAVLLDRSPRLSEHESALEVGWLLAELERRFDYGLDEMARRFDRSVSWVSRRLALVEVLPEAIQQQVREGKIPAQVALKFLCRLHAKAWRIAIAWRRSSPSITAICAMPANCLPLAQRLVRDPQTNSGRSRAVLRVPESVTQATLSISLFATAL